MIALILVAGNSRRMGSLTENCHKTMLDVGGKPILQRMIESLKHEGINEICFVYGYRYQELHDFVSQKFPETATTWVENPVYAETNTAYSVWLTRDALLPKNDDVLLINGDVVLDYRSIQTTIDAPGKTVLAVRLDRVDEEEVKVRLDDSEKIIEIGKHLVPSESAGESIGINRLSSEILHDLYKVLGDRIENGNGRKEFYEASFDELVSNGKVFGIADITHLPIMEVDTPEDYEEVKSTIATNLKV